MGLYRIAVLVDSLRRDAFNRKLASAITLLAPSDFSFQQLALKQQFAVLSAAPD